MKPAFLILTALLSCGFIVETPETVRERELQHKAWRKQMEQSYDFTALRKFLVQQIKSIGRFEGIDLSKSKTSAQWSLDGGVAQCGNWLFTGDPKKDDFTLTWTYEDIPSQSGGGGTWKIISLRCVKIANDRFEFKSASRTEDEYVVLCP